MNNDWDASAGNWIPADEPDADDAAIFNSSVSVDLANANESINGLTMSGGADLALDGNDMVVDGIISLSGASTNLFVGPSGSVLNADQVAINSGAVLALTGGTLTVNDESGDGVVSIAAGGTLSGHGIISLTDAVASGTRSLINNGTLNATSTGADIGGGNAATLSIIASDADARIDLDGDASSGVVSVARNDTLDVNVPLSDAFGGTINLAAGATFDVADSWIMNGGSLNANTVGIIMGTSGAEAIIVGAAFTQNGGTIDLDEVDSLRITSSYTANGGVIDVNGGTLYLDGGAAIHTGVAVNLFDGGVIQGFGTINADLNGVNADEGREKVLADNGVLTIAGDFGLAEVTLGTADDDGILEVLNPWSTTFAQSVELSGGELRGAEITNNTPNGIHGNGLVSARVINESRLTAEDGGTLIVENPANNNDWDGAGNAGSLEAESANLELRDDVGEGFRGEIFATAGHEIFTNGFGFVFQSDTTMFLTGGARYRSTHGTDFAGEITIGSAGATIEVASSASFSSLATTTLLGDLALDNDFTLIRPGASFTGGGALVNASGRSLVLVDGVVGSELAVTIVNEGTLRIEQFVPLHLQTAAQVQAVDYEQSTTGVWRLDLGGVGLTAFDRVALTGGATLDGTLDLTLIDGFVPALGQTFNILSAVGGVTGMFDVVDQPSTMPAGLRFDVAYLPTIVQLQVVSVPTFSADFDHDGDVDADDLTQWKGDFGLNDDSDADSDGDSDGADFLAWQRQLGSPSSLAASSVPEPGALALIAAAPLFLACARRKRPRWVR
jgi:hypothetical protein